MSDFASTPVAVAATSSAVALALFPSLVVVAWCCFHSPVTTYISIVWLTQTSCSPEPRHYMQGGCTLKFQQPFLTNATTQRRDTEEQRPDAAEGLEVDIELGIDIA